MKHLSGDGVDVYRVRQSTTHPDRSVRKAWYGRTWQAEWNGTVWAPRAYTRWGVMRKARRWMSYRPERLLRMARRRQWIRAHITQRSDEYYRDLRNRGQL